jgi:hypothetical protein
MVMYLQARVKLNSDKTSGFSNVVGTNSSTNVPDQREEAVAQISSPCETEAFTAKNAEHAESGMGTLMLYLSDLCVLCGKILETRVRA